ncbi:MAG: aminotransferase class IV [bacterium]
MSTENCLLNYFILNDELRHACEFNPDLLREGKGIYEVFRVINGIPLFLEEHIRRFYLSASLEKYSIPFAADSLKFKLKKLIQSNGLKQGNIRFQYLSNSIATPLFAAWITPATYPTVQEYQAGVNLVTLKAARFNPHSKRANLPVRFMAEEIIEKEEVTEVLLVNSEELVTECHRSNIFFIKGDTLSTPTEALVLQGITREKIIDLVKRNGIPFQESIISLADIMHYESCFISSTSKGVLPVRKIDNVEFMVPNPLANKISEYYENLVRKHLSAFSWN